MLISDEETLSDSYLRIRKKLNAWDTNYGGANRFKVTEAKLDELIEERDNLKSMLIQVHELTRVYLESLEK